MGEIQIKWKEERKEGLAGQREMPSTKQAESTRPLLHKALTDEKTEAQID